jgi:hypothetical protein
MYQDPKKMGIFTHFTYSLSPRVHHVSLKVISVFFHFTDFELHLLKSAFSLQTVFGGMACDQTAGICPQASSLAVRFIVNVVLRSPVFREVGPETIQLFEAVGVPIVPPQYSVPAIGGNVSQAYINCPIRKIPFAFSLSGSVEFIEFLLKVN